MDRTPYVLTKIPLAGGSLLNLARLLADNNFAVEPAYLPRLLYSAMVSATVAPVRLLEHMAFDRAIARTRIEQPPLFVLGHWRSGTTFLHNLLAQDRRFGYLSTQQAMFPHTFLSAKRLFEPFVAASLPAKRPMDDVDMAPDLPQEEEYAIGAYSPCAYYHGWSFPRRFAWYDRFVCMDSISRKELEEWERIYTYVVKKTTYHWRGKPLLLKNPPNTARVGLLRKLFPGAKFVHVYRNPYHVYLSTMKLVQKVMPLFCLQTPDFQDIEQQVLDLYERMHRKYFAEREALSSQDLAEVSYESLARDPEAVLQDVYRQLELPGFSEQRARFSAYLDTQRDIKTSSHSVDDRLRRRIPPSWDFVFERWGYAR